MQSIEKHMRGILFGGSILYAIGVYLYIILTITSPLTQIIRLEQMYALTAFMLLYITIVSNPLATLFPRDHFVELLVNARKYLVVCIIFFAGMHSLLTFFGQLGGFEGLVFLSFTYLLGITISFSAFVLLLFTLIMQYAKKKPVVYTIVIPWILRIIGLLILLHALMLGSHFSNVAAFIPLLFFLAFSILLLLEAMRIDRWIAKQFGYTLHVGGVFCLVLVFVAWYVFMFSTASGNVSLGIHAEHLAASNKSSAISQTKQEQRYTVDFDYPESITAGVETELVFKVYNASTGDIVTDFKTIYEKLMHVIVVNEELSYFSHIHPGLENGTFRVRTTFPTDDNYRIYTDFEPQEGTEQMMAFSLVVGQPRKSLSVSEVDTSLSKKFGKYLVSMSYPKPLTAAALSSGRAEIVFTLTDLDKNPITKLHPYLGSFGHMVMINTKTHEYLHVHPAKAAPSLTSRSGPAISFYPMNIYGSVRPGVYRVFAQFNPNGELITTDFVMTVE